MNETKIKRLKQIDYNARQEYLADETQYLQQVAKNNSNWNIFWNCAKWNLEKWSDKCVNDAKKSGIRDAEKVLLSPTGVVTILTRNNRLFAFDSTSNSYKELNHE